MRRALVAVARFWADFVLGDDASIAVAVGVALGLTGLLDHAGHAAWWPLPLAVVLIVPVSLRRAIARGG